MLRTPLSLTSEDSVSAEWAQQPAQ